MADAPSEKPKRRPRYRGTHPRQFHEKYKELNPQRYADDVAKILASGKTPAGMHRSIMVREILEVLAPKAGDIAVDATLGYGGHSAELLKAVLPGGKLIALDVDPIELPKTEARLRGMNFPPESLLVRRSNFAGLAKVLATEDIAGADVILADLGLSSMQIDDPTRGFTFKRPGPLDLRMNPQRGQPASAFLTLLDTPRLAQLLEANADEPYAQVLARAIVEQQRRAPITTTTALADLVTNTLRAQPNAQGKQDFDLSVRRVFQALRIAVNGELDSLRSALADALECVVPGGRIVVLAYHSLEDRIVKEFFRSESTVQVQRGIPFIPGQEPEPRLRVLTRKPIVPSDEETVRNPRARSAKLRAAERRHVGSQHT